MNSIQINKEIIAFLQIITSKNFQILKWMRKVQSKITVKILIIINNMRKINKTKMKKMF